MCNFKLLFSSFSLKADVDKFSAAEKSKISHMILRVGVGALLPAEGSDDVDEPPVVLDEVFFFFFSPASTFGVCPRTLPARARDP